MIKKDPESFSTIFAAFGTMDPHNMTVDRLNRDPFAQIKVAKTLADIQQKKFINLVHYPDQARIVMGLYAGDGVVTKITPTDYTSPYGNLPLVIFPFKKERLSCGDKAGDFYIENLPYLSTDEISQWHVDKMREELSRYGLEFNMGDDKPDNIGRLRDGTLAVLDGHAVRPKVPFNLEIIKQQYTAVWEEKLRGMYPTLYAPGFSYTQSEHTNYAITPRIPKLIDSPRPQNTTTRRWFQRILPGNKDNGISPK